MRAVEIDYTPLSRRPIEQELDGVRAEALAGAFGEPTAEKVRTARSRAWGMLLLFGGFITGIMAVVALVGWFRGEGAGDTVVVGLVLTAFVAGCCFAIFAVGRFILEPLAWRRLVRLILFCRSNGFAVEPVAEQRPLPGTLGERLGHHRSIANRVTWEQDGRSVEVGVYHEASAGSRGSRFTAPYVAISLPRSLPRMAFLGGAAVPVTPSVTFGVNVLPVDYPRQYRRRVRLVSDPADRELARRVFTDTLIVTLADDTHPANAEVRGEWFLSYPRRGADDDEQWWRHVTATVDLVVEATRAALEPGPDQATWEPYPGS